MSFIPREQFQTYLKRVAGLYSEDLENYVDTDVTVLKRNETTKDGGADEESDTGEVLPTLEVLSRHASLGVLLVGKPGFGKTSTLRKLLIRKVQEALSDQNAPIPVMVEMKAARRVFQNTFAKKSNC